MKSVISAARSKLTRCCSVEIGPGQIHQCGRVHVDVVETGRDCFPCQLLNRSEFRFGIRSVFPGIHLKVVALDENRSAEALADGSGKNYGDVFGGPLLGVGDLGARYLADEGTSLQPVRRPEDRARRVVGHPADVDRRDGELANLPPAPRQVQVMDGGRVNAHSLRDLPDQPARIFPGIVVTEHGRMHQRVQLLRPELALVGNGD
jgi:hypothetical protein